MMENVVAQYLKKLPLTTLHLLQNLLDPSFGSSSSIQNCDILSIDAPPTGRSDSESLPVQGLRTLQGRMTDSNETPSERWIGVESSWIWSK